MLLDFRYPSIDWIESFYIEFEWKAETLNYLLQYLG